MKCPAELNFDCVTRIRSVTFTGVKPMPSYMCSEANDKAIKAISLLCGPISPVVNLEMSSTASFFCGNAIYGCSGLGNCRMLKFLSIAFCVIDLISMLIRWNHSITNIFRIKLSRDLVFVSIPTFSSVRISNNIVKYSHRPPKTNMATIYMVR